MADIHPPFTTERLTLRRATSRDASFFVALFNSPGWLRYIGDRNIRTEAAAADFIDQRIVPAYGTPGHGSYVVSVEGDASPIGFVGVFRREWLTAPDFGYAFLPEGQGLGYAMEASRAVLALPAVKALPQLLAICLPDNVRSIRLLERLGFVDCGHHEDGDGVIRRHFRRAP